MYCQQCGTQLEEGMLFCSNCGAKQQSVQENLTQNSYQNSYQYSNFYAAQGIEPSPASVSFVEAIKLFFVNYVNFSGRSTKSEYWWAFLFNILLSVAIGWIPIVGQLASVALMLPGLALGIRRLHDTGKHWYYIFMGLIPIAGFIILIVQYCKASDGDNQWGPAPLKQ